jgi:3',5'-cyclic AMP phosphodiesterase CpdA
MERPPEPPPESTSPVRFSRREFVTGLGAFVASQVLVPRVLAGVELPGGLRPLRLGFLTDCHAMAENGAPAALDRTADLMNSLQPDLIIGGGDFVHGGFYSPGREIEHRWVIADTFLRKLGTRLEPIIGNHDFYDPLMPDGTPSAKDPRWRWRKHFGIGSTYRSFPFRGYRFLMLDSVKVVGGANPYRGWIDAAQLLWLDRELRTIPANQPIILCTHIPFKTSVMENFGAFTGPSPGRVRVINANAVLERLRNRPLALIMQGHVHIKERLEAGGVPCITGGAVCGKWWEGPNMGTSPGVGLIEITPEGTGRKGSSGGTARVGWSYLDTPAPSLPSSMA